MATSNAYIAAEQWHPKVRKDRTSLKKLRQSERSFEAQVLLHLRLYLSFLLSVFESSPPSITPNVKKSEDEAALESDRWLTQFDDYDFSDFEASIRKEYEVPLTLGAMLGARDIPASNRTAAEPSPLDIGVDWSLLDPEVVNWMRRHATSLVGNVVATTRNRIRSALMIGLINGEPRDTIARRIREVSGQITRYRAKQIAQTEIITAHTQGALQVYRKSDVVKGKRWVDGQPNACPLCSALNNSVVNLDGYFDGLYEGPPRHPGCRCTIAATLTAPKGEER